MYICIIVIRITIITSFVIRSISIALVMGEPGVGVVSLGCTDLLAGDIDPMEVSSVVQRQTSLMVEQVSVSRPSLSQKQTTVVEFSVCIRFEGPSRPWRRMVTSSWSCRRSGTYLITTIVSITMIIIINSSYYYYCHYYQCAFEYSAITDAPVPSVVSPFSSSSSPYYIILDYIVLYYIIL